MPAGPAAPRVQRLSWVKPQANSVKPSYPMSCHNSIRANEILI